MMASVIALKMILFALTSHAIVQADRFRKYEQLEGKKCLDNDVLFHQTALSRGQCASRCRFTDYCELFMYNPKKGTCEGCYRGDGLEEMTEANTITFDAIADTAENAEWMEFNGTVYIYDKTYLNFSDAVDHCKPDTFLARIDSPEKDMFLEHFFVNNEGDVWIGLTDEGHEGTWTWVNDSSEANYTNWKANTSDGHCASFSPRFNHQWRKMSCATKMPVLCEEP